MNTIEADEIADAVVRELLNMTGYVHSGGRMTWSEHGVHAAVWTVLTRKEDEK